MRGGILVLLLFFMILGCTENNKPILDTTNFSAKTTPDVNLNQVIVHISGIENGECVVPSVNLWDKPGGISKGAKVLTSVEGCLGLPVKVLEVRDVPPRNWYHVQTYCTNAGKSGWVSESLIVKE